MERKAFALLNLTEEKIGPCLVALEVQVEPERVDQAMHQAAKRISEAGRIAGFRKGKAPYNVVLRTYGKPAVLQEALDKFGNEILQEALTQQALEAYDRPSLELLSEEPLRLKFTVPTKPQVDLGNYRALRIEAKAPESISDAKVNDALEQVRKTHATKVPVERPATMGDALRGDVKIDAPDRNILNRTDAEVELQAGDEDMVPGFSAAMVGALIGETREFTLTLPEDFENAELVGKALQVHATVRDIREVQVPALDDELAKTVGDFDTLDELRADLRQNLEENAQRTAREQFEEEALQAGLAQATIEFPDVMVEEEVRHSLSDLMRDVAQQGFTFENWLRMNNLTLEGLRASLRPGVEQRLRRSLFLYNLAEREGLKIEAADIDAAVAAEIGQYPDEMQAEVRRVYGTENGRVSVGLRLLQRRALDKLISIVKGEGVLLPGDEVASRPAEVLIAH
ncbi:MAG: trigger factor [Chloroflexi bacterium]|nr:MAG: trigger factor [Chloroflexota bacterium]